MRANHRAADEGNAADGTLSAGLTQAVSPLDVVTFLKILKQYIIKNFKDVGPQFAQNIREIHQGESPHKNIYGIVTLEEKEKLDEEEIPYFTLPEIPPEFEN